MTASVIFAFVNYLLTSFREDDIETLIFLLHNIGLQLRKADPDNLKQIIDLFTQKRNSYMIETKLMKDNKDDTEADLQARVSKERKLGFLNLEL